MIQRGRRRRRTSSTPCAPRIGGTIEAQLQQVDRCIALQPADADCLALRGNLHMRLDLPREAREDFDRAIAADNHPYTHYHRAQALCALGDYEATLADFDTAIAGQPWQESLYPQRALARGAPVLRTPS